MLLAEAGAGEMSKFNGFDIFVILFTILILIGTVRLIREPQRNWFAIVFSIVSLLVFLMTDIAMIKIWFQ